MNLIRIKNQPTVLENAKSDIDELFNLTLNSFFNTVSPSYNNRFGRVNVIENDTNYSVEMLMPGADKNKIDIALDNNTLSVSYKNENSNEVKEKNYLRQEWSYNEFVKRFELPENVNVEQINASYDNGILRIVLDKKEVQKVVKQITVN